jgi:hypothetical protein
MKTLRAYAPEAGLCMGSFSFGSASDLASAIRHRHDEAKFTVWLAIRENQPNFAQNRQEAILSGELGSQLTPYTRGFRDLGAGETRIEDSVAEDPVWREPVSAFNSPC